MTRRRNQRTALSGAAAIAASLPAQLRSFEHWSYSDNSQPAGLKDYLAALGQYTDDPVPVMNAAGLSAADWYRQALTTH